MKYIVIDPVTHCCLFHKTFRAAEQGAKNLSRLYHRGVEIKREPVPYKAKKMLIVI